MKASATELPTNRVPSISNRSEKRNPLVSDHTKNITMKVQTSENSELMCQSKKKEIIKSKIKTDEYTATVELKDVQEESNGVSIESHQLTEKKNAEEKIDKEISIEISEEKNNGKVPEDIESNENDSQTKLKDNSKEEIIDVEIISLIDIPQDSVERSKSDEVVGSTTSELPQKIEKPHDDETIDETTDDDPSFICYDSSIMLKDVKIKLNDCLKENSKLMDSVNENTSVSDSFKDLSFGRTLRTLSGRSSIGRMRHVTIRQRPMTPNDSLFVNCSGMSTNQEEPLRFASEFPNSFSSGTPIDRKRKIDTDIEPSTKKIKKDEGGLLNTSLEYLKIFRKPLQVNRGYNFNFNNKIDITEDSSKLDIEETAEPKKWCILM